MKSSTPLLHNTTAKQLQEMQDAEARAILIIGGEVGNQEEVAAWMTESQADAAATLVYSSPTVDEIRSINQHARTAGSTRRSVVIYKIDQAKHEAQNALLKLLEEPTQDLVYILTASTIEPILPTVVSRCAQVWLKKPDIDGYIKRFEAHSPSTQSVAHKTTGGNVKGMQAYLAGENAIMTEAKSLVSAAAYTRLSKVNDLAKDRDHATALVLALQRIYHFLLTKQIAKPDPQMASRLEACCLAHDRLLMNSNTKLVLDELFISL